MFWLKFTPPYMQLLVTVPKSTTLCNERESPTFSLRAIAVDCTCSLFLRLIKHRDVNSPLAESGLCLTTNSTMAHPKRQKKVSSLLRGAKNWKCEVPTECRCTALGVLFFFFNSRNTLHVKKRQSNPCRDLLQDIEAPRFRDKVISPTNWQHLGPSSCVTRKELTRSPK